MKLFERLVVDHTVEAIPSLCREALATDGRDRPLCEPLSDADLLGELRDRPEGSRCWHENQSHGWQRPWLFVAWWTDAIGRKHVRVLAGEGLGGMLEGKGANALPGVGPPPLELVYPDSGVLVRRLPRLEWHVLCDCGLWGPPAELGWMGPFCAACHDRREEGAPPSGCVVLKGHTDRITSLVFLAGERLAVADEGSFWGTWDIRTGRRWRPEESRSRAPRLAGSPSVTHLILRRGSFIEMVNTATRPFTTLMLARVGVAPLLDLALSPDGQLIALLYEDKLSVYGLDGRERFGERTGALFRRPLVFSPDSRRLAVGSSTRGFVLWEADRQRFREPVTFSGEQVIASAFAPDGRALALALQGRLGARVVLWGLETQSVIRTWRLLDNRWSDNRLAFHPDGQVLFATVSDRVVAWDVASGTVLADLATRLPLLGEIAVSPDGRLVATSSDSGIIRLWPVEWLTGGRA